MVTIQTIAEMRALRRTLGPQTVGLVPTMGALHAGHLSLVRAARAECGLVVATIFVNPTQFGPGEDYARYPRTWEADVAMLAAEGVDVLFAPAAAAMYPPGDATWVEVTEVGARLDGASRPGHFRGVATVVTKLLNIVQPDRAYFGQKDAAQVAVLRRMVRDLHVDVEMVVCATVREDDGLAMSSRNRYLSVAERLSACAIPRALDCAESCVARGVTEAKLLRGCVLASLQAERGLRVEYVELVDAERLEPVDDVRGGALLAVAAWAGETRLIDNLVLLQANGPVKP
jgi:pantoate--beta-alanine ligase